MSTLRETAQHFFGSWLMTDSTNNFGLASLVFAIYYAVLCVYWVNKAKSSAPLPKLRSISGLDALDDAIGRATEMSRPVVYTMAGGGASGMAAIAILGYTAALTAKYDTKITTVVRSERQIAMAEAVLLKAYTDADRPGASSIKDVRYLSGDQNAFAMGAVGVLHRENGAAHLMFGQFFAESLILAEGGNGMGAIQVAGTTNNIQTPYFLASCDYTLLADEMYVAAAYLTQDRTSIATVVTQEYGKVFFFAIIVLGSLLSTFDIHIVEDLLTLY